MQASVPIRKVRKWNLKRSPGSLVCAEEACWNKFSCKLYHSDCQRNWAFTPLWQFSFRQLPLLLLLFFPIIEMGILTSLIVSIFYQNYVNISLFWGTVWKDPGFPDNKLQSRHCFPKARAKWGKETAEDRSGVHEDLSGQRRNHKCRWEGCAFYKQRASYASQAKMISCILRRVANKQRMKVHQQQQGRASCIVSWCWLASQIGRQAPCTERMHCRKTEAGKERHEHFCPSIHSLPHPNSWMESTGFSLAPKPKQKVQFMEIFPIWFI